MSSSLPLAGNSVVPVGSSGQSRTLDKGLRALEVLAAHPAGLGVAELAEEIGIQRPVVHRLLGTLRAHRLVTQTPDGRYRAALGLLTLSAAVHRDLRLAARPHLHRLADAVGATAFLTVCEVEEAVSACVVETEHTGLHLNYRSGLRHPLTVSAAGLAILAARPPVHGERPEVTEGRDRGYLVTVGELQCGAWGLASALPRSPWRTEASIGVVALTTLNERRTAVAVSATAQAIANCAA